MKTTTRAFAFLTAAVCVLSVVIPGSAQSAESGQVAPSNPTSRPLGAVSNAPTRVAVVSPARVFFEMREVADLNERVKGEQKLQDDALRQKAMKIQEFRDAQKLLKPNSEAFMLKQREITQSEIEFQAAREIALRELDRTKRMQTKAMFDKIRIACDRVAHERGYDIVLADTHQDFPENMEGITLDQLRNLVGQWNILYVRPEFDITQEVIASLDAEYKK